MNTLVALPLIMMMSWWKCYRKLGSTHLVDYVSFYASTIAIMIMMWEC